MCARIGCPADGLASPSCAKSNAAGGGRGVDCEHTRWSCEEHESRSFLPLMPLSRLAARHSLMLSKSHGGRVCGDVACVWPVPTRSLSKPCLGHKNRTRGAAQGPSKPRNRQMSQPTSLRAGPSQRLGRTSCKKSVVQNPPKTTKNAVTVSSALSTQKSDVEHPLFKRSVHTQGPSACTASFSVEGAFSAVKGKPGTRNQPSDSILVFLGSSEYSRGGVL